MKKLLFGASILVLSMVAGYAGPVVVSVAIANITGFGTGVATALGINVGTAGAPVINGGALGTPSSGTGTNFTGIPITGLTGLGTNQTTFLAANLTINGALKLNGSGTPSQAACADLSDAGTACPKATGTSGAVVPLLSTNNTWGGVQTFPSGTTVGTAAAGATQIAINGAASGTGAGPAMTLQANGSFAGAVGHYSQIFGGAYDASTALVSAGSIKLNANSSGTSSVVVTNTTVAIPTIASSSAAQTGTVCWTTGTGNLTVDTTTTCLLSGREFKHDIHPIDNADSLKTVLALKPSTYFYNDPMVPDEQIGFIADEVEQVDPRLISRKPDGSPRSVRYQQLTADLAGAIQAQQKQLDKLYTRRWCFAGWCW